MNAVKPPLKTNPFPASPADLGVHQEGCEGPERRDGYVTFTGRPDPPGIADGGVVLTGGRPHLGKSVLTHRCLHRYEAAGCLPVDLSDRPADSLAGPADCLAEMRDAYPLPDGLRPALYTALHTARTADPVEGHHELGRALGGRRLVVRLPRPDPCLSPAAIAGRVLDYARAARAANFSVYLFEFPYWADDAWTEVCAGIARSPHKDLVMAVNLDSFGDGALREFLWARLGGAAALDALFNLDLELLLRSLARQRGSLAPNNLTWFNALCHGAFEAALESGAAEVAMHHFLAAAVRIGAP